MVERAVAEQWVYEKVGQYAVFGGSPYATLPSPP